MQCLPQIPQKTRRASAACGGAFTLIELLLVISIIAVLVAVILPQFNLSGVKLRTAALGYMQAARYARTMALLYQVEVEIVCETGGVLRVEAGEARGEARGPYVDPDDAADLASSSGVPTPHQLAMTQQGLSHAPASTNSRLLSLSRPGTSAFDQSGRGALAPAADTNEAISAEELASAGDVATAIHAEQSFDGVHIQFVEYTDEVPSGEVAGETESFKVHYRSNGTCRPYRVRIADEAGAMMNLDVDMLGVTVIEGEGE